MRNDGLYLTVVVFIIAEVNYPKQIQPNSAHAGAVTKKKSYNCNTDCAALSFMKILQLQLCFASLRGMNVLLPVLSMFVTDLGVNWCTISQHNATE